MSAKEKEYIPSWLDDYPLTALEFRLFCRISRRGECTQSPGKLAKEWGLSDRTIRDAKGLLLAAGLIGRKPNGPQRFITFTLAYETWARAEDVATIRASVLNYRGKGKAKAITQADETKVDTTSVITTEDNEHNQGNDNQGCNNRSNNNLGDEQNQGNNNLGDDNQGNNNPQPWLSQPSTSVITTDIRESHEGNPKKGKEREQARGLPLTGFFHPEQEKPEQPDGRKKNGRKQTKPAVSRFGPCRAVNDQ
jgi:hypothetical protein